MKKPKVKEGLGASEEKKIERIRRLLGRINLEDIDRNEDLYWATSELINIEKHLYLALAFLNEKIKKEKDPQMKEYYQKVFNLLARLLKKVREERTKHLERIYSLKTFSTWCIYKHITGGMHQFGEVFAKDNHMYWEKMDEIERTDNEELKKRLEEEAKKDFENMQKDLETLKFLHDTLLLLKKFSETVKKPKE